MLIINLLTGQRMDKSVRGVSSIKHGIAALQ
jgi:hypothetical protein